MKKIEASLRRDLVLIFTLLLVASLLLLLFFLAREEGDRVRVVIDGKTVGEYSLSKNATYSLADGANILVIEDGAAYMREADCPDKTCVRTGRIRHGGERIVCLPNRITVTVLAADDTELSV